MEVPETCYLCGEDIENRKKCGTCSVYFKLLEEQRSIKTKSDKEGFFKRFMKLLDEKVFSRPSVD